MKIEYKNKNIKNMFKELKHEFPEDFGSCDGLTVDAIDFTDSYDKTYIDFENFRAIGKILNIVMKHLSKIEFK